MYFLYHFKNVLWNCSGTTIYLSWVCEISCALKNLIKLFFTFLYFLLVLLVPRSSAIIIGLDTIAAIWRPDCSKNYRRLQSRKFTCSVIFQADCADGFVTICKVSTRWAKREFCHQQRSWNLLSVSPLLEVVVLSDSRG